jgi:hypothetical protein
VESVDRQRVQQSGAEPRPIQALEVSGSSIVIGGSFTSVSGQPRVGLAVVDATTADPTAAAITLPAGDVVLDIAQDGANAYYVGVSPDADRLIGKADLLAGTLAEWIVPVIPAGQDPTSRAAYLDGVVYSGPAWDVTTAAPLGSAARWRHPAAVGIGVFELDDPLDGADGPMRLRFHALGTPISPRAPRNLVALHAGNYVYLSWTAPVTNDVESYVVRAGSASGYSNLADYDTGSTATELWATAPDSVYYVRVHARRAGGLSAPSNEVAFALSAHACNSPPAAPGPLSGSGGDVIATLGWGTAFGASSYVVEAGSSTGLANLAVLNVGNRLPIRRPRAGNLRARAGGTIAGWGRVERSDRPGRWTTARASNNLRHAVSGRTVTLSWMPDDGRAAHVLSPRGRQRVGPGEPRDHDHDAADLRGARRSGWHVLRPRPRRERDGPERSHTRRRHPRALNVRALNSLVL